MKYTIHDVARIAGVGIGTVSRVVNNNPNVKPATREKVLAVIAQLNYRPHPIARSMILRRTGSLGVIIPYFTRPFHVEILRCLQTAIHKIGCELVLYNVEDDEQRDHYFLHLPMQYKVDGLCIVSLPVDDMVALNIKHAGLPTVLIDAYSPHFTSIVIKNIEGAYQATQHLIALGHRRIAFINGIPNEGNLKFNQANDREIGFRRALTEANIAYRAEWVLQCDWSRQAGKQQALQLLAADEPPTALFVGSDIQAVGALEAARELGLRIPDQLSIIGFDGIELAELLNLSTMQQPIQTLSEMGITQLQELIENPQKVSACHLLDTQLVIRSTTAPPQHP